MKKLYFASAALLALPVLALAQQAFQDGDAGAVNDQKIGSVVVKWLNVAGKAVGVSASNPLPVNVVSGGGGGGGGGSGTMNQPATTVGTSSAQLLAAAAATSFIRVCVPITAANPIYVNWAGGSATTSAPSELIPQGSCVAWSSTDFLPTSQINAIASASTGITLEYK